MPSAGGISLRPGDGPSRDGPSQLQRRNHGIMAPMRKTLETGGGLGVLLGMMIWASNDLPGGSEGMLYWSLAGMIGGMLAACAIALALSIWRSL